MSTIAVLLNNDLAGIAKRYELTLAEVESIAREGRARRTGD